MHCSCITLAKQISLRDNVEHLICEAVCAQGVVGGCPFFRCCARSLPPHPCTTCTEKVPCPTARHGGIVVPIVKTEVASALQLHHTCKADKFPYLSTLLDVSRHDQRMTPAIIVCWMSPGSWTTLLAPGAAAKRRRQAGPTWSILAGRLAYDGNSQDL